MNTGPAGAHTSRAVFLYLFEQVWVAKSSVKKRLEDIPIPFSDVKNVLEEIQFEDETMQSRCRGWLVLKSRKYLQTDILFPGCELDCRFTMRGRTGKTRKLFFSVLVVLKQMASRLVFHSFTYSLPSYLLSPSTYTRPDHEFLLEKKEQGLLSFYFPFKFPFQMPVKLDMKIFDCPG